MQMRAAVLPWVATGGLAVFAGVAEAGAGDHVRFGSGGEFTPSLSLAGVYRTNNYLTVGDRFGSDPEDAAVGGMHLNVRPQLSLDWKSRNLELGFDAGYDMRKYFRQELTNLDRYRNYDARIRMNILPQAIVGVKLDSGIQVTGRETEAVNSQDAYLQQLVFRNTGTITLRPGNAMELDVGGMFEVRDIKVPDGFVQTPGENPSASLNARQTGGIVSTFNWQFLPKTAIVAAFERSRSRWSSNEIAASGDGVGDFAIQYDPDSGSFEPCSEADVWGAADCFLPVPNGVFTTFNAGIRGRFTEKVVLGAILGFTRATFDSTTVGAPVFDQDVYDATGEIELAERQAMAEAGDTSCIDRGASDGVNDDLRGFPCSLNGNLEIRYDLRKNHTLTWGFLREAQPVFFTNYMNLNRYYVGYRGRFADRHSLTVSFDANQQFYRGQVIRDDLWFRTRADVGWGIQKWLVVDTGVWHTARRSADGAYSDIEYDDVNFHAGVTLTY